MPIREIDFIAALPKTPSGKIQRFVLRGATGTVSADVRKTDMAARLRDVRIRPDSDIDLARINVRYVNWKWLPTITKEAACVRCFTP